MGPLWPQTYKYLRFMLLRSRCCRILFQLVGCAAELGSPSAFPRGSSKSCRYLGYYPGLGDHQGLEQHFCLASSVLWSCGSQQGFFHPESELLCPTPAIASPEYPLGEKGALWGSKSPGKWVSWWKSGAAGAWGAAALRRACRAGTGHLKGCSAVAGVLQRLGQTGAELPLIRAAPGVLDTFSFHPAPPAFGVWHGSIRG